ncbi:circadian clock protein KaiC [Ectothiorhodospira lacustris]|uniref:circadian clock protein KaiC n=1 Tax=Ectothiorhodospira lacustris TaxID=2899127 RepID=UPI001EE88932|nr:circadian clock protein KaiC [Ectothiorhodospira lacustris]MCG5500263.1 circadian clock protein KaiC [Ectothiorhodospira lacustris]
MNASHPSNTDNAVPGAPEKAPTGISGFDQITGGGLPRGRTTLLLGGPGSGKTVFALEFLVHGARSLEEPGIFVAFEERSTRILANAHSFGWNLPELQRERLSFVDAQPVPDLVQSGSFDLNGMLAALQAMIESTGARRIVFDALDIVLALLPDPAARRAETYRLHGWLLAHELTAVITAKAFGDDVFLMGQESFGFMQFMVDCAVILNHKVVLGVSQRNLRVQKYRGTNFDENELPFLIGKDGFEVSVAHPLERGSLTVSKERVSSGLERLDTMLGGGYYRGVCALITGSPGTAKTTLVGLFAQAACQRGERTLFVSFSSDPNEVIRDLASVGIRLARYVKNGHLRMVSARAISGSAELYLAHIMSLAKEHKARCLVIDPVSTWSSQSGTHLSAHRISERLINWSKVEGITLLCSCLVDERTVPSEDSTFRQISTLADTWIHLSYLVQSGERNRALSIIKSRGTAHSNQVRELILSNKGVTLADTYSAGGEVLMGTLRWQKEGAERAAAETAEVARKVKRVRLDAEEAELEVRLRALGVELKAKKTEKALLMRATATRRGETSRKRTRMEVLRGADVAEDKDKDGQ